MSESSIETVFIGGTGAIKPFAKRYYKKVEEACEIDHLVVLPNGGLVSIAESHTKVAAHIELKTGDRPIILIGHSQGALHAVLYAATHPNVVQVIILGAPIRGTLLCLAMSVVPGVLRHGLAAALDMHPGSKFLADLAEHYLPQVRDRLTTISCVIDGLVWPASSGHVWGAQNHKLPIWENHLTMVAATKTIDIIRQAQLQTHIKHGALPLTVVAA